MDDSEIFDYGAALNRVEGDRALFDELVALFFDDYPQQLAAIETEVHQGNCAAVERSAHNLKSALGHFGARRAFDAAYQLEELGRSGRRGELEGALAVMKLELETFLNALKQNLAR